MPTQLSPAVDPANYLPLAVVARRRPDAEGTEPSSTEAREMLDVETVCATLTVLRDHQVVGNAPLLFVLEGDEVRLSYGGAFIHQGRRHGRMDYYGPDRIEHLVRRSLEPQWDNLTEAGRQRAAEQPATALGYRIGVYSHDSALGYGVPADLLARIQAVYPQVTGRVAT